MESRERILETNFIEMFKAIAYKWRKIIIWVIVFMLLFGGYRIWKNIAANKNANSLNVEEENNEIEKKENTYAVYIKKTELNELDFNNVRVAVNMYNILNEYYNWENSLGKEKIVLQYIVKTETDEIGVASSRGDVMEDLLKHYIADGGLKRSLMENGYEFDDLSGGQVEIQDKWSFENVSNSTITNVYENDTNEMMPIYIICRGNSSDEVKNLAEYVKRAVQDYVDDYEMLENTEVLFLGEYQSSSLDENLLIKEKEWAQTVFDLYSKFCDFTSDFSKEQKTLFDMLKGENILSATAESIMEDTAAIDTGILVTDGMIKYFIFGGIVGFVLSVAWYAINYMLNGAVKTKKDFDILYNLYDVGSISDNKEYKGVGGYIDQKLDRIFNGETQQPVENRIAMSCANIKALCRNDSDEICFTSSLHLTDEEKKNIGHLISMLKSERINACLGENIVKSRETFEKALKIKKIILIEKTNVSQLGMMVEIVMCCKQNNMEILGVLYC